MENLQREKINCIIMIFVLIVFFSVFFIMYAIMYFFYVYKNLNTNNTINY